MFLVKRGYFNKTNIIKGLLAALVFSAFIYLEHWGLNYKLLNTILGLVSLYLILILSRQAMFFTGFFVGILWFYWVGISFQYYNLVFLAPLIILFFALVYGVVFLIVGLFDIFIYRIILIYLLSYVHPFGFNWFVPELMFVESYLPITKEYFALILACIYMFIKVNNKFRYLAFVPLYIIHINSGLYIDDPKLQISMPQLKVQQDRKWVKENLPNLVEQNFKLIDQAILEDKDLVILPETVFPFALNRDSFTSFNLLEKSKYIDIIAGAIYFEEGQYFNATYHFSKGEMKIAKKVVLVPFGEKIPLPKVFVDFINDTFYNGAKDYEAAKKPTDFNIAGVKFRNAICYEATSEEIYQNLNGVKYMIAISNNAWFTPSIEPTLQNLLLKYYAKKYDITILHSINGSSNQIVRP